MADKQEFRAARLPRDPGPAGWNELLDPPADPVRLEGAERADLLIVGAGFAGLAAAHRAFSHDQNQRIVVLEASRLAAGPAGRNSGFMIDLPHDLSSSAYAGSAAQDLRQIRDNRMAIEFAAGLAKNAGLGTSAFDRCGKINAAASPRGLAHNEDYSRHLKSLCEDFKLLDAVEMKATTGIDYYQGGLFTPGAAIIQPAAYIRGIARLAEASGVNIYENTPLLSLQRFGAFWTAKTPLGEIRAPKVILAINGHANSLGLFSGRLMHTFTYASMTRTLSQAEERALGGHAVWGVTPSDPLGSTVRKIQTDDGARLLMRNRFTYDPSMEVSDKKLAVITRSHDLAFKARFPMLEAVEMSHRWGGRLCLSWNNVSAFGEVAPRLFSACCHNGLGTTKGTFGGMMAADLAFGQVSDPLRDLLADPAPTRLPPAPFDRLGASLRLRFGEYRAGAEL